MQTLCVGFLKSQRPISYWFQRPFQSPLGIYLHLLIPSKKQSSKMTFLTSFSKSEKRTETFLNSILNHETSLSFQARSLEPQAALRGGTTRAPWTTRYSCWCQMAGVQGEQRGTTSGWRYMLKSYRVSCVQPDFQGWLDRQEKTTTINSSPQSPCCKDLCIVHPLHSFQRRTSSLHLQFFTAFALTYSNPTFRLHN